MGVAQSHPGGTSTDPNGPASPGESQSETLLGRCYDEGMQRLDGPTMTTAPMQQMIKGIGGALITAFMVIVVLSQVYQLDIISSQNGPFANLTSDYVTYGTAALGLIGVAIIVGAASVAMNMFGGSGGR
ncbi:hypothetical protein [Halostella sp. PRR32]|uniref:hypothetical protein n=1 Tax=Halostella sp. PRR32 TaxID=3098147 RepID=UPI002B1DCC8C|nr:hypothetical protein [Halostella sp. PRR32]